MNRRVAIMVTGVLVACTFTLLCGAALKGDCDGHGGDYWRSRQCYSDINSLYYPRHLDKNRFPYTHVTRVSSDTYLGGFNEYPVLTGTFMWVVSLPVKNASDYLALSMFILGIAGLWVAGLLVWETGWRALAWAASPVLALYAFHNWDILAVTATVVALMLWRRGHRDWAAVALGIGAAFKLYPFLLLIALVADRVAARDYRGAARTAAVSVGTFAIINLPFVVHDPFGWWATYQFQLARPVEPQTSIWGHVSLSNSTVHAAFTGLVLLFGVAILAAAQRLRRDGGDYPTAAVSASLVCVVLALDPIGSPQYALWLLPFFALVRVGWAWWGLFTVIELTFYAGLFAVGWAGLDLETANTLVDVSLYARTAVLLVLPVVFLTSPAMRRDFGSSPRQPYAAPRPG